MRGVLKKTAIILLSLCFCFVLLAVSSYIYMKISAPKAPESWRCRKYKCADRNAGFGNRYKNGVGNGGYA